MTAWSGNADGDAADQGFTLTSAPGGGACAKTMAERPFAPGFTREAGQRPRRPTYTPFPVHITRADGQQELKGVDVTLPPGATAKLAGVPYCPPADDRRRGRQLRRRREEEPELPRQEPDRRRHGRRPAPAPRRCRSTARPTSPVPTRARRSRWSWSPRRVAGPVRPRHRRRPGRRSSSTRKRRRSTPSPTNPRRLRRRQARHPLGRRQRQPQGIHPQRDQLLASSRPPARCRGGGADPTNPAAFSSFAVSDAVPARAAASRSSFKPKLNLRLFGATKRAKHPHLRATLQARGRRRQHRPRLGRRCRTRSSSTRRASATICTRVQFAAEPVPEEIGLRPRPGVHAAARQAARRPGLPALLEQHRCRTWSPTSKARSTSTWSAGSTASRAASAPPSTASPTCRCSKFMMTLPGRQARPAGRLDATSAKAGQGDRPAQRPERQEGQQAAEAARPPAARSQRRGQGKKAATARPSYGIPGYVAIQHLIQARRPLMSATGRSN